MSPEQAVQQVYTAINTRNIDDLLTVLHEDVEWPTGEGETCLHGHKAVREQMTKVFASNLIMQVADIHSLGAFEVVAQVRAVIRDRDGRVQLDEAGRATYTFQDGLIRKIDLTISPQQAQDEGTVRSAAS